MGNTLGGCKYQIKIMSEIISQKITYKELRDRSYVIKDDRYGIAAFMTESVRQTLLACPNNNDDSKTAMYLKLCDGIAVGRMMMLGTRIKVGDEVIMVQTGGAIEVHNEYRRKGLGVGLIMNCMTNTEYDVYIGSLYSTMALPIFRKLNNYIFEIPQFVKFCNLRTMLKSMGMKGVLLELCSAIANLPIKCIDFMNRSRLNKLKKKFNTKKETIIPEWAGRLATNDGHKYMELHDRSWLQWNLDYNLMGHMRDKQSFYAIYDKKGKPQGFFMTKERFEERAGRYQNIIRGTIVEWATIDANLLSEADIILMAMSTFSPDTFHIATVTSDKNTEKRLKLLGFIRHGNFQMSFKDKKEQFKDASDQNLWRLRYGCCNTIIL